MNETLKSGGRSGMAGAGSHRARALLVVAEVALATVALVGAGLFVRSFHNAQTVNPGFDRNNVLLARFYLRSSAYSNDEIRQFCLRLRERLQTAPGVREVNYADFAPLGSSAGPYTTVGVEGYVPGRDESMAINRSLIAPGYFKLLRIPLLAGRDFTGRDDARSAPVVIVNETFARRFFRGADPVGRKLRCWGEWRTIVGLARDSKHYDPVGAPLAHFYVPFHQRYDGLDAYFFIRTEGDPTRALASLRREVAAAGPECRRLPRHDAHGLDRGHTASAKGGGQPAGRAGTDLAGACGGGPLQRDGLRRHPADAGDRCPHGARRAAARSAVGRAQAGAWA